MAAKKCDILRSNIKKNETILRNLNNSIENRMETLNEKTFTKNTGQWVKKDNIVKIQNLIQEKEIIKQAEQVIKSDELLNIKNAKVKEGQSIDSFFEEEIVRLISNSNRFKDVYQAEKVINEALIKSGAIKDISANLAGVGKKLDDNAFKSAKTSKLNEPDVDKKLSKKQQEKLKEEESVMGSNYLDSDGNVDYKMVSIFGMRHDFFGKLFKAAGEKSNLGKVMALELLSDTFGMARTKKGEFVPQSHAIDVELNKIHNKHTIILDRLEKDILNKFKDDGIDIAESAIHRELLEITQKRIGDFNFKLTPEQQNYKEYFKSVDEYYSNLATIENKKYGSFNTTKNYSPTMYDIDKIKNLVAKHGDVDIKKMISNSIKAPILKRHGDTFLNTDQLNHIDNIANDMVDSMLSSTSKVGQEFNMAELLNKMGKYDDLDELKLYIDDQTYNNLKGFQKQKIDMDSFHVSPMTDGTELSPLDLLYENPFATNKKSIIERTKRTETKPRIIKDNNGNEYALDIFDDNSVGKILTRIEVEGGYEFRVEFENIIKDLRSGQFIENELGGKKITQGAKILKNFNTATYLGSVLLPSLVEAGNLIGVVGLANFLKARKEVASLMKKIESGNLTTAERNSNLDFIYYTGHDRLRNEKITETAGDTFGKNVGDDFLDKVEEGSNKFADLIVNKINQLSNLTGTLRSISFVSYVEKISTGAKLSKKRAAQIGLKEAEAHKLQSLLKDMGEIPVNEKMTKLKETLTPAEFNLYETALLRKANNLVLNPMIGEGYHLINKSPLGKIFFQFQSYITYAFTKMSHAGVIHRDMETLQGLTGALLVSFMVETTRRGLKNIGSDEEFEFSIEKGLSDAVKSNSYSSNIILYTEMFANLMGYNINIGTRNFDKSIKDTGDFINRTTSGAKINDLLKFRREVAKLMDGDSSKFDVYQKFMRFAAPDIFGTTTILNNVLGQKIK